MLLLVHFLKSDSALQSLQMGGVRACAYVPARLLCLLALLLLPPAASQVSAEQQIASAAAAAAPLRPLWRVRVGPREEAAAAAKVKSSTNSGASGVATSPKITAAAFFTEHGSDRANSGISGSAPGPGVHVKRQHSALQCPLPAGAFLC